MPLSVARIQVGYVTRTIKSSATPTRGRRTSCNFGLAARCTTSYLHEHSRLLSQSIATHVHPRSLTQPILPSLTLFYKYPEFYQSAYSLTPFWRLRKHLATIFVNHTWNRIPLPPISLYLDRRRSRFLLFRYLCLFIFNLLFFSVLLACIISTGSSINSMPPPILLGPLGYKRSST